MTPSPSSWNAETLWQALVPVWPGISVEVLPEVASTNSLLLQRTADPAPCLLVAEHQTQGRGRMGRQWLSAPGASLTFSLGLPLAPQRWEGLSLAVGLAIAEALDPAPSAPLQQHTPRLMLKWPNDLWLLRGGHGRKLGGILVETTLRGGQRYCVVGVGLNVRPQSPSESPSESPAAPHAVAPAAGLTHGYACLQEWLPGIEAPQALARVALPLARALRQFEGAGFAPLMPAFAARDLLRGQAVTTTGEPALQGLAQGVDADGALLVQTAHTLHRVHSGEVSVRLQQTAPNPASTTAATEQP